MRLCKKLHYILCGLLLLCSSLLRAQNTPNLTQTSVPGTSSVMVPMPDNHTKGSVNYTRIYIPKIRITDANVLNPATAADSVAIETQYTDGRGIVEQKIRKNTFKTTGGVYQHTIVPVDVRSMANQYRFMPYSSSQGGYQQNAISAAVQYHNAARYPEEGTGLSTDAVISTGLAKNTSTTTERSITEYAPGKGRIGQNRGLKTLSLANEGYHANFLPEANIRQWRVHPNGLPVTTELYPENTLVGTRTTNEGGAEKTTFSDREGKLVYECILLSATTDLMGNTTRTYAVTYYVYDAFGRLRFIISPKGVDAIKSNWTMTATVLQELCFEYQYDAKGRQVAVHKPGEQGFTEMVYDKAGRTVMRRSPLEAAQSKWELVFYDKGNRVIATGLLSDNQSRSYWQGQALSLGSAGSTALPHYYIWGSGKGNQPPLSGLSNTEVLSYNYYDDYTQAPLSSEHFDQSFIAPYLSTVATAEAYVQGPSTYGRLTATAVKVLKAPGATTGLQDWTYSKVFYDDMGRVIYTVSQHAGGAKDTAGVQYSYAGQVLTSVQSHQSGIGSSPRNLQITSHAYEDYSGRLLQTSRKLNTRNWEPMVTYTYDELGRIATKTLGNGAETQTYTYTVRGELKGINEQYALTGDKGGLGITFGEALRYDYGFQLARYDGLATGMVWRGSGGSNVTANAYGYQYDQAGRMIAGRYNEAASTGSSVPTAWTINNKNFTEFMSYDVNGNIRNLQRFGVALISGVQTPVGLDRLVYTYLPNSNRLDKVIDQSPSNYGVGDFQQGSQQGYSYDASGNLTEDKSKNISSISYTFFNKPQVITYTNGNTIRYSYDAAGTKLQEQIQEGAVLKTLSYLGNGVYQNEVLQYLGTAEGRTDMTKTTPQEQYFVKDHLGNIRSIVASALTSDTDPGGTVQTQTYMATYELTQASTEEQLFEDISTVREENPASLQLNDTKVAGLGQDKMVGSMLLLKVMSGDKLHINAESLYEQAQQPGSSTPSDLVSQIISSVAGAASGLPAGETGLGADMAAQIFRTTAAQEAYAALMQSATDPDKPKAYLNYLFFDEEMNLHPEHSQLWQADGANSWAGIGMDEVDSLEMPQNGYIAVYLTSESAEPTYFNNMSVSLDPGVLIEEKHYYPYGLPMAGMGSTAANSLANRQRYQGNEYREELNLRWMDFHNRQYDPQLGRFLSIDPLADAGGQQTLSPYHAMGDNPVMLVDPTGMRAMLFPGRPSYQVNVMADMLSRMPTIQSQYDMASHFSNYSSPGMSMLTGSIREAELMNIVQTWLANALPGTEKLVNKRGETVFSYYTNHGEVTFVQVGNLTFTPTSQTNVVLNRIMFGTRDSDVGLGEENEDDKQGLSWINGVNDLLEQGTFIISNVLSFVDTKPGKILGIGGAHVWKSSTYSAQKGLVREFAIGSKGIARVGNILGGIGLALTATDMIMNGVNTSNTLDAAMGIVSFIPGGGWIAGSIYFIGNAVLEATTGKNLGQHIDGWIQD